MYKAIQIGACGVIPDTPPVRAGLSRQDNFGEPYVLFKEGQDGTLKIPRRLCSSGVDRRSKGTPVDFGELSFTPRNAAQERILARGSNLIDSGESFVIQAGTGVGKTVMALVLAYRLGLSTIVVVDQSNIRDQWIERIQQFLGLSTDQIGVIQGDTCRYKDKPITVAMVHSLCKQDRYPEEVYNYFGLALFDEVHVMGADTFNNACYLLNTYWRIGLSATPRRKDGRQELFLHHIGPVAIVENATPLTPKIILSASGWQCPTRIVQDDTTGQMVSKPIPHKPGRCTHIVKTLTNCEIRTKLICRFVKQAYDKGRNIVVFSELKDFYLPKLEKAFILAGIPLDDIGWYVGGMSKGALAKASAKRIVLTTYKMTAKAVDCPWWDTAVFATPLSDVTQSLGRILREFKGKSSAASADPGTIPVAFDVVDLDSYVFKNYYKARLRYYREIGAPFGGDLRLLNLR